jgi:hypothetical protein
MGVCGKRHAQAAPYPRGKNPGTHWIRSWVGLRSGVDTRGKILSLPGIELRPLGRPARSQTLYWQSYRPPGPDFSSSYLVWVMHQPGVACNSLSQPIRNCCYMCKNHDRLCVPVHFNMTVCMRMSGRAMAQAVSRRPLTAESWVRARVYPCGICGGQSGTGAGFSPSFSVFPCQYNSTVVLCTHISSGGWIICPLAVVVQRRSLTPLKSTMYNVHVPFNNFYINGRIFMKFGMNLITMKINLCL